MFTLGGISNAAVVIGFRIIRVSLYHLGIIFDGAIIFTFFDISIATVVIGFRIILV